VAEFPVPGSEFPEVGIPAIASGPDGNLWFTESAASKIGRISVSEDIIEYPLSGTGRQPSAITAGPDGNMWFTEGAVGQIGRITLRGTIKQFRVPVKTGTGAIASGPAGDIWFTAGREIGSIAPDGRSIDRLVPKPRVVSLRSHSRWITKGTYGLARTPKTAIKGEEALRYFR
jgi:virginiamycin B lyase